jgi:SpoVK/Ycf46/Vps4 family AAA+-type ATPase
MGQTRTSTDKQDTGMDTSVDLYINKESGKMYVVYAEITPLIYYVRLADFAKYKLAFDIFNQKYRKASALEITKAAPQIKKFMHRIRKLSEEMKESTATASTGASNKNGKCPFVRFEEITSHDTLDRLIVSDTVRDELIKCANFVLNGDKIERHWKVSELTRRPMTRRLNFYGPPGGGKTTAARVLAKLTGKKLAVVDCQGLNSIYVSGTAHNIQALFEGLKPHIKDTLVFMDEADDMLLDRDRAGHYEAVVNSSRSALLTQMDQFAGWMVFATNRFKAYDPAFVRRIGRHVYFPLPDFDQRLKIWRIYTRDAEGLDMRRLAEMSEGLSGADILMVVTNAIETVSLQPEQSTWILSTELLVHELEKTVSAKTSHRFDGEG